jgi:hypothetical protein
MEMENVVDLLIMFVNVILDLRVVTAQKLFVKLYVVRMSIVM